uniref:RING-type domain-containing protein n=1 Tax=Rhabditophanes sp. KR3021 TaxID=114890 RepID=A0AC35U8J7_9BILA
MSCSICNGLFDVESRLGQTLACGHKVCDNCLFSVKCHQQYYLLDKAICPACNNSTQPSSHSEFRHAPSEFDNNKLFNSTACSSNNANITVIHVPDNAKTESFKPLKKSMATTNILRKSISKKILKKESSARHKPSCLNCQKKISYKKDFKNCRLCLDCNSTNLVLKISCLECCVNEHNTHKLVSILELKEGDKRLWEDIKSFNFKMTENSFKFETLYNKLQGQTLTKNIKLFQLKQGKEFIMNEIMRKNRKALHSVEKNIKYEFRLPHSLGYISNIRKLHIKACLEMQSYISVMEQLLESTLVGPLVGNFMNMSCFSNTMMSLNETISPPNPNTNFVSTILAINPLEIENPAILSTLRNLVFNIEDKSLYQKEQIKRLLDCISHLNTFVTTSISASTLLLFQNTYLDCFKQMATLLKLHQTKMPFKHTDIWKCIQTSFGELLRIGSEYWSSADIERIILVQDISYLCKLFSDCCDTPTITLCLIEVARIRTAVAEKEKRMEKGLDYGEQVQIHLALIDDNLMECRKKRKLLDIRSTKSTPKLFNKGFKRLFKRTSKCIFIKT